jgi:hypothetical protein
MVDSRQESGAVHHLFEYIRTLSLSLSLSEGFLEGTSANIHVSCNRLLLAATYCSQIIIKFT